MSEAAVSKKNSTPVKNPNTPNASVPEQKITNHSSAPVNRKLLPTAPKLVNDVMETLTKINPFSLLGTSDESKEFASKPITGSNYSQNSSMIQIVSLEDSLKRKTEISEGVAIRLGELIQDLNKFATDEK